MESPCFGNSSMMPDSFQTPRRSRPRHSGQSSAKSGMLSRNAIARRDICSLYFADQPQSDDEEGRVLGNPRVGEGSKLERVIEILEKMMRVEPWRPYRRESQPLLF